MSASQPQMQPTSATLGAETVGLRRRRERRAAAVAFLGPNPVLVGLDLAKDKHAVWIAGKDLLPLGRFMAAHSLDGLAKILAESERQRERGGFERTVYFMEPTSYFWQQVAEFLDTRKVPYRLVSPLAVDRQREIEHQTFAKGDFRDAEHIVQLGANGQWLRLDVERDSLFADLAGAALDHELLVRAAARERNRAVSLVGLVLPEFFGSFSAPTGHTARALLKALARSSAESRPPGSFEELRRRAADVSGVRLYRQKIRALIARLDAAPPFGVARLLAPTLTRIGLTLRRWELFAEQLAEVRATLLRLYERLPFRPALDSIPFVTPENNATLLGLVGDPRRFDRARCLVKLAGTECRENHSGTMQGSHSISRRGRPQLRFLVYRIVLGICRSQNPLSDYCRRLQAREKKPLVRGQAMVATGNKYLRLVHHLCVSGQPYDAAKLTHVV